MPAAAGRASSGDVMEFSDRDACRKATAIVERRAVAPGKMHMCNPNLALEHHVLKLEAKPCVA